jgi:hypothetical protein
MAMALSHKFDAHLVARTEGAHVVAGGKAGIAAHTMSPLGHEANFDAAGHRSPVQRRHRSGSLSPVSDTLSNGMQAELGKRLSHGAERAHWAP